MQNRNALKEKTKSSMTILLLRLRLQLILIRSNRRGTTHPLQLALDIIANMFVVLNARGCTSTPTGGLTDFFVIEDGRRSGGCCVAGD